MNKRVHRLVFDRKRGMRVPAAEHVRSAGKAAGGQTRAVAAACAALTAALAVQGEADARSLAAAMQSANAAWTKRTNPGSNIPVLSTDRGNDDKAFSYVPKLGEKRAEFTQKVQNLVVHWDSYNLAPEYTLKYIQPAKGSVLNKIWDLNPSVILGKIEATGEVILENQNAGFYFGSGARVEAARFVATALSVSEEAFKRGLRASKEGGALDDYLVFGSDKDHATYVDADGNTQLKGIRIERGAEIRALAGGDVLLAAPAILNEGRIETPQGQTVLAAGQKVYLMSTKADQTQRGLVVAVDAFQAPVAAPEGESTAISLPEGVNTIEQAEARAYEVNGVNGVERRVNAIVAEKGQINLVGMAIRQNGLLSATTAVRGENGEINLIASKTAAMNTQQWVGIDEKGLESTAPDAERRPVAQTFGSIEFGAESRTEVMPSSNATETQVDKDVFLRSVIAAKGADVRVKSGAQIVAPAGNIELLAAESASDEGGNGNFMVGSTSAMPSVDGSRLTLEKGAVIDVSGLSDVVLSMSRNQMAGRVFKIELADQPLQRDGVLYRQNLQFDARSAVTVADVKGFYEGIRRDAREWSTVGGNVSILGAGDVSVDGASINVSGGKVTYEDGVVKTSLLRRGNRIVTLDKAQGGERYDELINAGDAVAKTLVSFDQGFDAGSVTLSAGRALDVDLSQVKGTVTTGLAQRTGQRTKGDYSRSRMGRSLSRPSILADNPHLYAGLRPQGFTLNIGSKFGEVGLEAAQMRQLVVGAQKQASTDIAIDALKNSGLAQLNLQADAVNVKTDVSLNLGAEGGVKIAAKDSLVFDGDVRAAGGRVDFSTTEGSIIVGSNASLNVSGDQVDAQSQPERANEVLSLKGGEVVLSAGKSLLLGQGSEVDVSAGIQRQPNGAITKGSAGSIALTFNRFTGQRESVEAIAPAEGAAVRSVQASVLNGQLELDGRMVGFGFDKGGTLTLGGAKTITLQNSGDNGQVMGADVVLDQRFFEDNGFTSFDLRSIGDIRVRSDANFNPTVKNFVANFRSVRGEDKPLSAWVTVQTLGQGLRQGIKLKMSNSGRPYWTYDASGAIKDQTEFARIHVEKGANLNMGAGGSLGLSSSGRVQIDGTLRAKGGDVAMSIAGSRGTAYKAGGQDSTTRTSEDPMGYVRDQAIVVGKTGQIDVSGIAKTSPLVGSRLAGEVLGGGQVTFNADNASAPRGQVILEKGSLINVSGESGAVTMADGRNAVISKGAGQIVINSADGFMLAGDIKAQRPDQSVAGGQLTASVSRDGRTDEFGHELGGIAYPDVGERRIDVWSSKDDVITQAESGYAKGLIAAETLNGSGLDRIHLRADQTIELHEGVSIQAQGEQAPLQSVALNTRALTVSGEGVRRIQATRVALGDINLQSPNGGAALEVTDSSTGTTGLEVHAGLIEVHGHSAIRGASSSLLDATLSAQHEVGQRRDGEVRMIGRTLSAAAPNKLSGSLNFENDLTLRAGQIYATTMTDFTVNGKQTPGAKSKLTVEAPAGGSASQTPLSALAKLTLQAHDVLIKGVVRQPFGAITIRSTSGKPELADSSLLSVSGDGVKVPVGSMINKSQWVYKVNGLSANQAVDPLSPDVAKLDGSAIDKGILVEGHGLTLDSQARLEAQAGGDLLAWEFQKGVGGTKDVLASGQVFAVLPGYTHDFAPHDSEITSSLANYGSDWRVGDQVQIETNNNVLPAGRYTLMPARYGVLPGAVLVSVGPSGLANKQTATLRDDGSVVVAGYRTSVGTNVNGGNDERLTLILEPEQTFRAKSDLAITSISTLLKTQAKNQGDQVAVNPGDAGRVSLVSSGDSFEWDAAYNLAGKDDLAGGQLDLSMDKMVVLEDGQELTEEQLAQGFRAVRVSKLINGGEQGAESILLGGYRTGSARDAQVHAKASNVVIGTNVVAKELLAVAKSDVTVVDGVSVKAEPAARGVAKQWELEGNGAALVVSAHADTSLTRIDAKGVGRLSLGKNVTLSGGSVQLDSAKVIDRDASAVISATTLGVGAGSVTLGQNNTSDDSLGIGQEWLQSKQVQVRAYDGMTVAAGQTIGNLETLQKLVLDTPVIAGETSALKGDVSVIKAQSVELRNTSESVANSALSSQANLVIETKPAISDQTAVGVRMGEGDQRLAFNHVQINTTGDVVLAGKGAVHAQKDLTIDAARVTALTGADTKMNATSGVIQVKQADRATSRTLNDVVGSGAKLTVDALRFVQAGTVDLRSGQIDIRAAGDGSPDAAISFSPESVTRVAGWSAKQGDEVVAVAPGGTLKAEAKSGRIDWLGEIDVSVPASDSVSQVGVAAGRVELIAGDLSSSGGLVMGQKAKIKGQGDRDELSGSLSLDVSRFIREDENNNPLSALASMLKEGGVHRELVVRDRTGDLILTKDIKADRIILSADDGSLTVADNVKIDAVAPRGGVVQLHAGKDLTLMSGASISADSTELGANGGDVLLASTSGRVVLESGSRISAKGDDDQDGRVVVRAKTENLQDGSRLLAKVDAGEYLAEAVSVHKLVEGQSHFEQVTLIETRGRISKVDVLPKDAKNVTVRTSSGEGVKVERKIVRVDPVTGARSEVIELVSFGFKEGVKPTVADKTALITSKPKAEDFKFLSPSTVVVNATVASDKVVANGVDVFDHASDQLADKSTMMARLGMNESGAKVADVRAGIELQSKADIRLTEDWAMNRSSHVAGSPVFLTLRAEGDVQIKGWVSDGFNGAGRSTTSSPTALTGEGSSFRFAAGADLTAANVLQTQAGSVGQLTVAADKGVRTTSGSIELAAAGDIVLAEGASNSQPQGVVYVAGRPDTATTGATPWQQFTHHGGRVELNAGQDVKAPSARQGFGNWFLHTTSPAAPLAWASSFDAFKQGVGSMGGGNVRVTAGRDVVNLGVVAPTSGVAKKVEELNQLTVGNGGDILVRAQRDVKGGMMFLGRGEGVIEAGDRITAGTLRVDTSDYEDAVAPVLGLMDGRWRLAARNEVQVSHVYNPTALNGTSRASKDPRVSALISGSYVTYTDRAAIAMSSAAKDVVMQSDNWHRRFKLGGVGYGNENALLALHGSVPGAEQLKVTSGDPQGRAALALLPGIVEAAAFGGDVRWQSQIDDLAIAPSEQGNLSIYAAQDVILSGNPVRMLDRSFDGDVQSPLKDKSVAWPGPKSNEAPGGNAYVPSELHAQDKRDSSIHAGRDISFENGSSLSLAEALTMSSGRDILSPDVKVVHNHVQDVSRVAAGRNLTGEFKSSNAQAQTKYSGWLSLIGSGELRVSAGQTLELGNGAGIQASGDAAKVVVYAGANSTVNVDRLVDLYLKSDASAQSKLVQFVESVLQIDGISYAQALAYYRELSTENQVSFARHQLALPSFAKAYAKPSEEADLVWSAIANARGIDVNDRTSGAFDEYLQAQNQLVSFVRSKSSVESLTFEEALKLYQAMPSAQRAEFIDKRTSVSLEAAMAFLSVDPKLSYANLWQRFLTDKQLDQEVGPEDYRSELFQRYVEDVVLKEIQRIGGVATAVADSSNTLFNERRKAVRDQLWAMISRTTDQAALTGVFESTGDLNIVNSKVHTLGAGGVGNGGIDLWSLGGGVYVGPETSTDADKNQAAIRGVATYGGGDVRSFSKGDFQVASQKVHIVGSGDMVLYSAEANIDSGRGSNTTVTLPPKVAIADGYGTYRWGAGKSTVGSGMAIFEDDLGRREGKISLLAPRGEVRALDAYVDAPTVELAGPVLGADNFKGSVAGGASTPPIAVNLAINTGLGAETAAGQSQAMSADKQTSKRDRPSLITVDVLEMGAGDAPAAGSPSTTAADSCAKGKDKEGRCLP